MLCLQSVVRICTRVHTKELSIIQASKKSFFCCTCIHGFRQL